MSAVDWLSLRCLSHLSHPNRQKHQNHLARQSPQLHPDSNITGFLIEKRLENLSDSQEDIKLDVLPQPT